jgi:hypothetical protein
MMTISTEGRGMQPTGNSSYGITGILELVTEGLFPVVESGKFETNIRIGSVSSVALWEEDLDIMNGSCITFKY